MTIELSEKIVFGLQDIQQNSEMIDVALQILEDFVYETDEGTIDAREGFCRFDALRNIRLLKNKIKILYPDNN